MNDATQPLLFIASDRREAEPWVARWSDTKPLNLPVHWARSGQWKGRSAIAIANGVGRNRAAAAIRAACSVAPGLSGAISIGTAGALDPTLAIADIVVASAVTDGSVNWPANSPHGPNVRCGLVHSSENIAGTAEKKRKLNQTGAIIVEMEAAGIAEVAQEMAIRFYCVRTVSDLAGESFFIDFENLIMPDGRFDISRLLTRALRRPVKGVGELLRLRSRTALAARRLGEFLDQCEFPI